MESMWDVTPSLTTDMWTSGINDQYICISLHAIDANFQMVKQSLGARFFAPPHDASHIVEEIKDQLTSLGQPDTARPSVTTD